jgi:hypothetical protein
MQKLLRLVVLVLICHVSVAGAQQSAPPTADVSRQPIRVEISQPAEMHPSWEKWISLVEKVAWPVVVALGVFLFRKPLSNFLDVVGKRATEISIGGLGIKLPTMNEAQLGEDVLTFRAADTFMVISSSAKTSLFTMFEQSGKYEFVAINLGRGDKWLSSRLYIFATILQRMKALRCIVLLSAGADTESQFIGATTPDKVRWGLAMLQPWLEGAYAQAYAKSLATGVPIVRNETGAMDAEIAEQLVKDFLSNLTVPTPPPVNDFEWVTFTANQSPEHATWLSEEYLEQGLGYALWKDVIVASETKKEAKMLLKCSAPYVAKIKRNGEFLSLIDRIAFVDEMMGKIGDKLET